MFFAGTLIHVADVGGISAAGLASLATDTFVEGLLLPPVRLLREGEPVDDVMRIIGRNSRTPDKVVGDVQALVAGVNVIARRVDELHDRFGAAEVAAVVDRDLRDSERRMRASLAELPPGRYESSFTIDSDGVEARTFEVCVAVTLAADGTVDVDLAGTSAQARGAINASVSQTLSGIVYAIRCFADPTIPMNEGCFRPLRVHLPPGSLVNPDPPAACGGRLVSVAAATEAILQALAQAAPERAVAASGLIHVYALSGAHPDGTAWLTLLYEFGGLGARNGADGADATGAFFLGGRSVIPQVEPLEAQYPFRVARGPAPPRLRRSGYLARRPRGRDGDRDARRRPAHRAGRPHRDVPAARCAGRRPRTPGLVLGRAGRRPRRAARRPAGRRAPHRRRPLRTADLRRRRVGTGTWSRSRART